MSDITFVADDTGPSLTGTLTNADGTPFDLTSAASVRFQMRLLADRRWLVNAVATIVDAAAGTVRYDWQAGDLATPGEMSSRWFITFTDTTTEHTDPENTITVEPQ